MFVRPLASNMRPTEVVEGDDVYECFDCGARVRSPERRVCPRCGGRLMNIGRARDL